MREILSRFLATVGLDTPKKLLGIWFVIVVAFIWVIASFVVQGIESSQGVHPIILTYIANSMFAFYLPIYGISYCRMQRRGASTATRTLSRPPLMTEPDGEIPSSRNGEELDDCGLEDEGHRSADGHRSCESNMKDDFSFAFRAAMIIAPLWFLAQLTFNASLLSTSVTSNTILSSASALFTYLFSVLLMSEKFTITKLLCIIALIVGTAMVTVADAYASSSSNGSEDLVALDVASDDNFEATNKIKSTWGDLLCLISSIVYGGYTVAIRMLLGEDETAPMTLFFGIMGGLIFIGIGPLLGIVTLMNASFESLTWAAFGIVVLKGLLDNVLSDYLWARAILLVGPTIATSGLAMQVPIAIFLDPIFGNPSWMKSIYTALLTFLGGTVILAGFFGITASGRGSEVEYNLVEEIPVGLAGTPEIDFDEPAIETKSYVNQSPIGKCLSQVKSSMGQESRNDVEVVNLRHGSSENITRDTLD